MLYPEAGGSSSFARHAFNELVSFFAAWGADAHLHRHGRDLGVLRAPLPGGLLGAARARPRRHHLRRRPGGAAGAAQHQGHRGVGPPQPGAGDRRPADPDRAGRHRDRAGASTPTCWCRRWTWGSAPTLGRLRARDRGRDGRLHRASRRSRTWPRRRRTPTARSPAAPASRCWRWSASTRCCRRSPCRRCP